MPAGCKSAMIEAVLLLDLLYINKVVSKKNVVLKGNVSGRDDRMSEC